MTKNCAKSCTGCEGTIKRNRTLMTKNEDGGPVDDPSSLDRMTPEVLLEESGKFGEPQKAEGAERTKTLNNVKSILQYMQSDQVLDLPSDIQSSCLNRHELCSFWAVIGKKIRVATFGVLPANEKYL